VADDEELIRHILGVYEVFDKLNSTSDIPERLLLAVAGATTLSWSGRCRQQRRTVHRARQLRSSSGVVRSRIRDRRLVTVLTPKGAIARSCHLPAPITHPGFEVFSKPLKQHFDRLRIGNAQTALYSCVTAGRSARPREIRALAAWQWSRTCASARRSKTCIATACASSGDWSPQQPDRLHRRYTALQPHAAIPSNVAASFGYCATSPHAGAVVAHGLESPAGASLRASRAAAGDREDPTRRMLALGTGSNPRAAGGFKAAKTGDRSQELEVRSQKSEVPPLDSAYGAQHLP